MRKSFALGLLSLFVISCAGTDADLEKAKYYLRKGGTENAVKALAILDPMVSGGGITGFQKVDLIQLYAGAKVAAAGFNSSRILASLLYTDNDQILKAIRSAGVGITDDSSTYLADAEGSLSSLSLSADFDGIGTEAQSQVYFQLALVKFLQSMRVFLKVSGFAAEDGTSFDPSACETLFNAQSNVITNSNAPAYALSQLNSSKDMMVDSSEGRLSAQNKLTRNLQKLIDEVTPIVSNASDICTYLNNNK